MSADKLAQALEKIHSLAGGEPFEYRQIALEALAAHQAQQAEPVAWVDERAIGWLEGRSKTASITTQLQAHKSPERPMPLYASPQPAHVQGWQPIETAPKDGRTVQLGYFNSQGKWRSLRGQWMSADYISEYWEDPDAGEPGWYETSVEKDDTPNCWRTEPTHWAPLLAAPQHGDKT